jgi:hypothetical protein
MLTVAPGAIVTVVHPGFAMSHEESNPGFAKTAVGAMIASIENAALSTKSNRRGFFG